MYDVRCSMMYDVWCMMHDVWCMIYVYVCMYVCVAAQQESLKLLSYSMFDLVWQARLLQYFTKSPLKIEYIVVYLYIIGTVCVCV